MKLYSKEGVEMMDVKSISKEGDRLAIKGKMMGAMQATIYVGPEDMWSAFKLFPFAVILQLPVLLVKGWMRSNKKAAAKS